MITSSILDGKIPYRKQGCLKIVFSGTRNGDDLDVEITLDNRTLLTQTLTTKTTTFLHMFDDEPGEHELRIYLKGNPQGAMLHIHSIFIEGLNMKNVVENSGTCVMDNISHIPSEYMGQVGYQSLKFTTPIYPWLFANERYDTYYPH